MDQSNDCGVDQVKGEDRVGPVRHLRRPRVFAVQRFEYRINDDRDGIDRQSQTVDEEDKGRPTPLKRNETAMKH